MENPAMAGIARGSADYAQLLAMAVGEAPAAFFTNLHRLFRQRCDAPLMCVNVALAGDDEAPRTYYPDGDEPTPRLVIDQSLVARAIDATKPLVFEPQAEAVAATGHPNGTPLRSLVIAPIRFGGTRTAYLAVASPNAGAFGKAELELAGAAADVAALVISAAQARDEARARGDEIRLLIDAARALASERDLKRLFARFRQLVGGVMEAESFFIALGSPESGQLEYPYVVDQGQPVSVAETALDASLAGHVFRVGKAVLVSSAAPAQAHGPEFAAVTKGERAAVSAIYAPMRIGERPIGVISVQSARPNAYTDRDRDLLVAIAEQAAVAVENSQYLLRAEQRARELKLLADTSRIISTQLSLRTLCQTVGQEVRRAMDAPIFFVALRAGEGALHIQYHIEGDVEQELSESTIESALAGRVIKFNQPVVLQTQASSISGPSPYFEKSEQVVRSIVMAPLRIGKQCVGVLSAQSYRDHAYEDASGRLLAAIGEQMALAIQNAQLFSEAQARADRDPLTNLYHHRYLKSRLEDEVERARRVGEPMALLMLDLDRFKQVNDTYGHLAGDEALKLMSAALVSACRTSDVIGRYGGDEFMVILPQADQEHGIRVADRIEADLADRKLRLPSREQLELHVSMGLATFPDDAKNSNDLIARADAALYESKRQGRRLGRVQRFGSAKIRLLGDFEPVADLIATLVGRDAATRRRVEHDNRLAAHLTEELKLSERDAQALLLASVLYDVGKIAVPDQILRKEGPLTPAETALVRRHAELGAVLIHHLPEFATAAMAIYYHQERWDGGGYPDKRAGESIPLLARVVALMDAYSAMIGERPYHKGMKPVEAIAELRRGSGSQFDPNLVERFIKVIISSGDR